jgi:hypothetical protein
MLGMLGTRREQDDPLDTFRHLQAFNVQRVFLALSLASWPDELSNITY